MTVTARGEPAALPRAERPVDAFPATRRPLPWLLAIFLGFIFLVPIDATDLRIHLPVSSHIDRFVIIGLLLFWVLRGGDQRPFADRRRSKVFVTAVCVYLALAVASLLFDAPRIINLGTFTLAEKRFATLLSFLFIAWFALTALRREDLKGLISYLLGLGCLTSVGVLIERRTGFNAFYNLSAIVLKPIATVMPAPTDIHPLFGSDGRLDIVGPTSHGLAVTAMLTMVMPFALVRALDAVDRRSRLLYGGTFLVLLAGAMSTDKKTAVVVPVAMLLYLACYRPRQILRLLPIGLAVLVIAVHFTSPGALGSIFDKTNAINSNSTAHRIADFSSDVPDVLAHPVIGRGFGTLDVTLVTQFRINDNEYVDEIMQVGILGLLAYIWVIVSPIVVARRVIRSRDPAMSSIALAASAGCVAYLAANGLFDAMSFVQAPYIFFAVSAVATVACSAPRTVTVPAPLAPLAAEPATDRVRELVSV